MPYGSFSYGSASYGGGVNWLAIIQKSVSDSGLGVDSVGIKNKISITDNGIGPDIVSIKGKVSITDNGVGADIIGINKKITIADSGVGTETIGIVTLDTTINLTDSGQGTETIGVVIIGSSLTDSGQGIDTIGIKHKKSLTDSGQGLEVLRINTTIYPKFAIYDEVLFDETLYDGFQPLTLIKILISDNGIGVDTVSIITVTFQFLSIQDSGQGLETFGIEKFIYSKFAIYDEVLFDETLFDGFQKIKVIRISVTDSGVGTDTASAVLVTFHFVSIQDSGQGKDIARVRRLVGRCLSDRGKGKEVISIYIRASIVISDTGLGVEALQKKDKIKLLDSGQASELLDAKFLGIRLQEVGIGRDRVKVPLYYWDKYVSTYSDEWELYD